MVEFDLHNIGQHYYDEYSKFMGIMRGTVDLTGLKRVHIRILYALYTLKKDEIKTAAVVGETIGKYHPHGDQSIADAIETLVKLGIIKGYGNWGNFHMGLEYMKPAAMRYTSVGWTPLLDYIFEHINQVEFIDAQIDPNKEPLVLPTPLPLGLLNIDKKYTPASLFTGLSPGIRTLYPQFNYRDLINFICEIISEDYNVDQIKKTAKFPEIYLGDNVYLDYLNQSAKNIWFNTETFKIKITPKVLKNPTTREVTIYALTTKRLFSDSYIESISKGIDTFIDKSTPDSTEVYIKFTRTQYYNQFVSDIEKYMTTNLAFNVAINDFNKIYTNINLFQWILLTVLQYKAFTTKSLNQKINEYDTKISEIKLIKELRPYIREALKHKNTTQYFLESTKDKFDINKVNEIITKHNIKKLLDTNLELETLLKKKETVEQHLKNIDSYLINKYQNLKENIDKMKDTI